MILAKDMIANPEQNVRRLYMDNAATSSPKPKGVWDAMRHYTTELGASAGRGSYAEALETGRLINECRRRICRLFSGEKPEHVIFTLNCSDALNLAIKGIIKPAGDDHVICTEMDHNSVLRPLNDLQERGWITQTRLPVDPKSGQIDLDELRRAISPRTRLIALAHVSNVTGTMQPIREIGQIAREHGVTFLVDAAQSAGHVPIDVRADCIDLLAAPGHKGMLGPPGTGFLYIRPGVEKILHTTREGGTGTLSQNDTQPDFLPDKYEPGSHNAIGILGLSEGVRWIAEQTVEKLAAHDRTLVGTFFDGIADVEGIKLYGLQSVRNRVGVLSVAINGFAPQELAAILESSYGILTRAGIHCAPHAHEALGTLEHGGTTRFSFGPFIAPQDVQYAADCLAQIALQAAAA
jgi:cysteine desulfurase / selenocysteine lyase